MAKAKSTTKRKAAKPAVRIEKYTKIIATIRRSFDYLTDAVSNKTCVNKDWGREEELEVVRKGDFLFLQVSECDETFRIPVSILSELAEAVE